MNSSGVPTTAELTRELMRLSRSLDVALDELRGNASRWATAENDYRMARATHQLKATENLTAQGYVKPTVAECAAHVDLLTAKERVEAHISDALRDAYRESVRSRIAQLSALQSVAATIRGEMEMMRRGQTT